ncbi:N-acetylglucosamine-6-phosphate deacetylase [Caldicoprobacter guelmensis]|uniref:N-acetylglucosamine-6-phosphate deacetylase n=1 Tax=Caldicoprobacter guelmensis TaxID=1170224 RepID=UPI0019599F02|nr:N-acetylglucosamine-6-phosphate deacetylase [Caldicoprobacter guelmensis]MBM7582268.1 N-acetylglucosamine-6-phosphate deacetylase [Caldicoprobacter guelmensis]
MKILTGGKVYLDGGWKCDVDVVLKDGKIFDVSTKGRYADGEVIDVEGNYVCPGFIDIHVHGCKGRDVMDGSVESLEVMAEFMAAHGTTSFLATTMTYGREEIRRSLKAVNDALNKNIKGAQILGVHLEGPFINAAAKGAHDEKYILPPSRENFKELVGDYEGIIKRVTMAPDVEGAKDLVNYLVSKGIIVSMGHTAGTYEQCMAGFEWGMTHVTHMYNAMSPLKHREPGAVGAAFDREGVTLELIADLIHVHPAALRIAVAVKGSEKVALITDAMAATGIGDGEYDLGGLGVVVKDGVARLKERGNLAGSTLTQDQALRNMVLIGIPLEDAVKMLTEVPADIIGMGYKKGRIKKGFDADLVVLDGKLHVSKVFIKGAQFKM